MKNILFILLLIPTLVFGQVKGLTYGGKAMLYGDKAAGAGEFPPTGLGDIYYVSTSGDDAKDGLSEANAWETPQHANDNATPGSTIALKKGDTWSLATALGISSGGTVGNPTTWDGGLWGTGANAIIQASGNRVAPNAAIVNIWGCKYVTFQNITIDGNDKETHGLVIGGDDSKFSPSAVQNDEAYIIIQDCEILDCGIGAPADYQNSLLIQAWNNNISNISIRRNTIDGSNNSGITWYAGRTEIGAPTATKTTNSYCGYNTVTNCGTANEAVGGHISVSQEIDDLIVEHNTITQGVNGHAWGIVVGGNNGHFPLGTIYRYNDIHMTDVPCVYISGGDVQTGDFYCNLFISDTLEVIRTVYNAAWDYAGSDFKFYFNTVIGDGIQPVFRDGTNCTSNVLTIRNNIFVSTYPDSDNAGVCVGILDDLSATLSNNTYHRTRVGATVALVNYGGTYYMRSNLLAWDPTSVITDPTFTAEFTNLHLQTGSPAIDAGVTISGIDEDIEGNPMQTPDPYIGAYQTIQDP